MTEPSKPEQSTWMRIVQEDAGHSAAYVQRFRNLAAQGRDLVGEARLVDAMLSRGSGVLDAGWVPAGSGRTCTRSGTTWSGWTPTPCSSPPPRRTTRARAGS